VSAGKPQRTRPAARRGRSCASLSAELHTSATIAIRRPQGITDRLRSYRVLVDGEESARLRGAASVLLSVQAGLHTVQARIDWVSSPQLEIDLRAGETIALECTGQRNPFLAALHLFVRRDEYLKLEVIGRNAR
jgi:hypothetical protein